jgi:hypothetical protein
MMTHVKIPGLLPLLGGTSPVTAADGRGGHLLEVLALGNQWLRSPVLDKPLCKAMARISAAVARFKQLQEHSDALWNNLQAVKSGRSVCDGIGHNLGFAVTDDVANQRRPVIGRKISKPIHFIKPIGQG